MARVKPETGGIYHVYNRGVEKRNIFSDDKDYLRFIHDLFEFNDKNPAINLAYYVGKQSKEVGLLKIDREPRKLLVELIAFCLMPNHFHLLVRQREENGLTEFMRKIGTGYTNYFNKKYDRVGGLFQGRFKAVLVNREEYLIHLPFYIHTNPLDIIYGSSTSIDWDKKIEFLNNYRWSSYLDYIGRKNFPSVTSRNFLLEFFGGEEEYKKATEKWVKERDENIEKIREVILD